MAKKPATKKKAAKKAATTPRKDKVVKAVGASGNAKDSGLAQRVEAAMSQAISQAYQEGVTEPEQVKERMMSAREIVLKG